MVELASRCVPLSNNILLLSLNKYTSYEYCVEGNILLTLAATENTIFDGFLDFIGYYTFIIK